MTEAEVTMEWVIERCEEDADCLLWQNAINEHGQPKCTFHHPDGTRSTKNLRRVVWNLHSEKPLKPRLFVQMTCENKHCLNPDHMRAITKSVMVAQTWKNMATRVNKVLAVQRTTRALRGKLDMEKARYIRSTDRPAKELAAEFGVSQTVIHLVRRNAAWKELGASPFAGLMG
jgi:hypothetical protein